MSTSFNHNDSEDENLQMEATDRLISSVSNKLKNLNSESHLSSERILKMQETIVSLKCELESVVGKVEENVGLFKGKITRKIYLVLSLLKKKQTHIQATLDNCYKIIDNLMETFLNVGHELEKDILVISFKVKDFDSEIKSMIKGCEAKNSHGDNTMWFINNEGRLTKRKNVVLSTALPQFKVGDKKSRKTFITRLDDVFSAVQVPKTLWVKLASNQLIGMARDWWNMHNKKISWSQFAKSFTEWSFDNCVNTKIQHTSNQDKTDFEQCDLYNRELHYHYKQRFNDHRTNTGPTHNNISSNNNYTLTHESEESDEIEETSSDEKPNKRKYSIYTASNNNLNLKKRKIFEKNEESEIKNSPFINTRYKLRKRK